MPTQNLTPPQPGFIERHFPRLYNVYISTIGIVAPNIELRYDLVKEMVKTKNLEQQLGSLRHDYDQAHQEAWKTHQELEIEKGANQTREKRLEEILAEKEQLVQQIATLQQEYTTLEERTQLQLGELQHELQAFQTRCHDLEQQQKPSFPDTNTLQELKALRQEYKLRELISQEHPDDFEYRCAITQIYTPTNDNTIDQDLETALLASLEKTAKTKIYQQVTLHIADKLFNENFPKTAASLYNTLLKYFNSDAYQPTSPTETKYTNITQTRNKLISIIKTNPQHAPAVFEIANSNLQNKNYNLAEELGIAVATATNNSEYWQFVGDVVMQGPYANRPKSIQWAEQCYQKARISSSL